LKNKVRATMHGAISIVNAIATGNGAALGISLKVTADVDITYGSGIKIRAMDENNLIRRIVYNILPKQIISENSVNVSINSEIPVSFGLKSSSAVSNAVALACWKLITNEVDDEVVLESAVRASLDAKVSVTGAYDDSTACYFGGFVLTNNYARKLIRRERAPKNLYAIIFLPANSGRGNINQLSIMSDLFFDAFKLAEGGEYWKAMKLNGVIVSAALSAKYEPALAALQKGAFSASISGNGPSVAAVTYEDRIDDIKLAFSQFNGTIIVSKINNQKASVEEIFG
jgi:shikimate kinase